MLCYCLTLDNLPDSKRSTSPKGFQTDKSVHEMLIPSINQDTSIMSSETAFPTYKNILEYLNINGSIVSLKQPDFFLSNGHFLQICKEKNKNNLTWPNLSTFFSTSSKCYISKVILIKFFKKSKDYVEKLNRAKNFNLKNFYLSSELSFSPEFPVGDDLFPSVNCSILNSGKTSSGTNSSEFVPRPKHIFKP
nr:uncharacterized protein LOC124811480 [Hydra vulgaris]